jgi:hypothetical protein
LVDIARKASLRIMLRNDPIALWRGRVCFFEKCFYLVTMKRLFIAMSLLAVFCTAVMTVGYSDASAKTVVVADQSETEIYSVDFIPSVDFGSLTFESPTTVEVKQTLNYVPSVEFPVLAEKESQGVIRLDRAPPKIRYHRWIS